MRLLALLFALLLAAPALAQNDAGPSNRVTIRLSPDHDAAVPGTTLRLAVEQMIVPGWHTYWTNPGDSGEPMRITWSLPADYKVSDLLWPAPERVPYGPLMNFGYSDHAVMLTDLTVPASAKPGTTLPIHAKVRVLVCDEICIPEDHEVTLDIPIAATANTLNDDLFDRAGSLLPQPVDWKTITELDANEVRVRISVPPEFAHLAETPEDISWFPEAWGYIENASDQTAAYDAGTGTLTLRQTRDMGRNVSDLKSAGYVVRNTDQAFYVSGGIAQASAPVMGEGIPGAAIGHENMPIITLLAFAFIGGMILNLMPCVFPILSMKALNLVSLPRDERTHAKKSGIFYGLGVVATFMALGGLVYVLRAAGDQLGWGFQLQNPAVVTTLAWLMFLVGLNLAGVFDLRVAFGGEMLLAEKHHPLFSSFMTGILATLVATPCSAPFMATAVGAAMTQSMPVALGIFAAVGLGLAFPFTLLCMVPALQKILPRPGAWMVIFRQVLSFPMFASVVWLVWVVAQQGGPSAVAWTLGGMVTLALAIWLIGRQPVTRAARTGVMVSGIAIILLTLASLALVVPVTLRGDADNIAKNYKPFNAESLDHALNDTNKPVFVNMTASWCITCLVNETVTLDTPETRALFKDYDVTYFKGDWTNEDPAITNYLQRFNRSGVPIYVFYAAPDPDGRRADPVVLPQILSYDDIKALLP